MESLFIGWAMFCWLVFTPAILYGLYTKARTAGAPFSFWKATIGALPVGGAFVIVMFVLTYVGAVPYDRYPLLRFVNWLLPFGWVLFSLFAWFTGRSRLERCAPGLAMLVGILVTFGTGVWSLHVTQGLVYGLLVAGIVVWGYCCAHPLPRC